MSHADHISTRWEIASEFGREKTVINEARRLLLRRFVPSERVEEVLTAVGEACLNALEHGNGLRHECVVVVHMDLSDQACTFRIYDEGSGFDDERLHAVRKAERQASDPRGWGLLFISSFADKVSLGRESGKFYVELLFYLEPKKGEGDDGYGTIAPC